MVKQRPNNFMSFSFNNNETKNEIDLVQKQLANFSQYAVDQFAFKDNAIKNVSSQANTLTFRINGIEKRPFINVDYITSTAKFTAPINLTIRQPSYEENNTNKTLVIEDNTVVFTVPGIYMISYAISASVLSNFSWLDFQTNVVIPGSVLNITKINTVTSLTFFVRVQNKLFAKLRMTTGSNVSILVPSKISVSGPLFFGQS